MIFCSSGRKTQIVGKFRENSENFRWKFYRKIEFLFFLIFLENLLLKIEPSEITPFSTTFFRFREGDFPPSPWLRPWLRLHSFVNIIIIICQWSANCEFAFTPRHHSLRDPIPDMKNSNGTYCDPPPNGKQNLMDYHIETVIYLCTDPTPQPPPQKKVLKKVTTPSKNKILFWAILH